MSTVRSGKLPLQLDAVAEELAAARRVLFITGAGISADSGLPTYRGTGGLYEGRATADGMSIERALSGPVFRMRPEITWKYLAQIEETCRGAQPNAAHLAIAWLEQRLPHVLTLTQNVDGLHRQAGSRALIEIHGDLRDLYCPRCGYRETPVSLAGRVLPPPCPACAAILRPDVVLFDEPLPAAAVKRLRDELASGFDLVLTIGTSANFPYIVEPVALAMQAGVPTVEINPQRTPLSDHVDFYLPLGAAAAMSALLARLQV